AVGGCKYLTMSNDSLTSSVSVAGPDGPAGPVTDGQVAAVREFNRFYTNIIGLLREGHLDTPYSLTEARVLFELAREDVVEAAALRGGWDRDAGYRSGLLPRFEADGLVRRTRSPADGRRQVIGLTEAGRAAFADLDARSAGQIRALLAGLAPDGRQRLTGAMATIREVLEPASPPAAFLLPPPVPADPGRVVQRHGALHAAEYGWDGSFEALVAQVVAGYATRDDHRGEAVWIAELGGEPAGCVFCVRKTDTTAQLRLLLVEPRARGLGMGGRLVAEGVSFARRAGYREIVLGTNDVLHVARRLYHRG